jgi:hypothetical protein
MGCACRRAPWSLTSPLMGEARGVGPVARDADVSAGVAERLGGVQAQEAFGVAMREGVEVGV